MVQDGPNAGAAGAEPAPFTVGFLQAASAESEGVERWLHAWAAAYHALPATERGLGPALPGWVPKGIPEDELLQQEVGGTWTCILCLQSPCQTPWSAKNRVYLGAKDGEGLAHRYVHKNCSKALRTLVDRRGNMGVQLQGQVGDAFEGFLAS